MIYRVIVKRIVDILLSLFVIPFVFAGAVILFVVVRLTDGGTVFYTAQRRGYQGGIFSMYKFRTMKMNAPDIRNADNSTYNAPDDPRVTKVGRFLRKTSLDELPQFLNVLKGDMSLIGPRPITIDRPLEDYDEKRRIRLTVKPGITGYAQAYFRNSITQEEKLEKDAWYAKNLSACLDLRIFLKTILIVAARRNVYAERK